MEQSRENPSDKKRLPFIVGGIVVLILALFVLYNKPSPEVPSAYHSPQIALLRVEVQDDPGTKILKGRIRNISDHKFDDIRVYVSWYTDKGEFVKSGFGMAEFRPLMAGQQCEFEVPVESNPMMGKYKIQFRDRETNWILPYEMRNP
jgi:hypothetical protein